MKVSKKQAGRVGRVGAAIGGIVAALLWGAAAIGQQPGEPPPPEAYERCATELSPESAAFMLENFLSGVYDDGPHIEDVPTMRIRLTAIRDAGGANGLSNRDMDEAIAALNNFYVSIGLHFVESAQRRFIDSAAYIDVSGSEFNQLLDAYNTSNMVDVYFVRSLTDAQGNGANGQATFSTDTSAGVVVVNGATPTQGSNYSTFPHEIGHYFDLLHTHETAFGVECPNGINCLVTGDQVCDTPADPNLTGRVDGNCNTFNLPGLPTQCQFPATSYSPATNNIMSYSTVSCRNWITGGQVTRLSAAARSVRSDHQYGGEALGTTWVDFGAQSSGSGASSDPKGTLPAALALTQGGGRVVINASAHTSSFTGTINQSVTIDSYHGASTIGR